MPHTDLAHIQQVVGGELGVSEWQTVDQQRIDELLSQPLGVPRAA